MAVNCGNDQHFSDAWNYLLKFEERYGYQIRLQGINYSEHNKELSLKKEKDKGIDANAGDTETQHTSYVLIGIGAAAVSCGAAVVAAPLGIAAAGFGAGGVSAGSWAAAWQATIGNVAAGSLFASLQSAGAAGFAGMTSAAIGTVGATVGGGTSYVGFKIKEWFNGKK